jgi:hypothetical protein
VSNGVIVLTESTGLRALDARSLTALGRVTAPAPAMLTPTRYGGARAAFFVRIDGRERVYALGALGGLMHVADYRRRPLLVDAARSRRVYASLNPDRRTIAIYAAGDSAMHRR